MTWVYAVVELPWDQGAELLVLPRSVAEQQAHWSTVFSLGTWGGVRDEATPEEYEELLERAGFGTFGGFAEHLSVGRPIPGVERLAKAAFEERQPEDLPGDEDPFLPSDQIPAYSDGDFPPDVHWLMNELLPAGIVSDHGERYQTSINGTYARFDPPAASAVVKALTEHGIDVEEDADLLSAAVAPFHS